MVDRGVELTGVTYHTRASRLRWEEGRDTGQRLHWRIVREDLMSTKEEARWDGRGDGPTQSWAFMGLLVLERTACQIR